MRVLTVMFLQVLCGLFTWGCYVALFAIVDSGNWTPFSVFGLDIFKTIGATVVASAGLTGFATCLSLFGAYGDGT